MWRVQYTPGGSIAVIFNRWFWTEAAARRFASRWPVSVIFDPMGGRS